MKIYVDTPKTKRCVIKRSPIERDNEMNLAFIGDVLYDYLRYNAKKKANITELKEKAWLCYQLYACLVEKDEERLRSCVQRLADENLNEIVTTLVELGYVF